jgi:hypothetical protein
MSAIESTPIERTQSTPRAVADAEALARRALGIAMNSLWGGASMAPLPPVPPALASEARLLLLERVPDGCERECALDMLRAAAEQFDAVEAGSDV